MAAPSIKGSKSAPGAVFNAQQFADLIEKRGLDFQWSRALPCSCRLRADGDQWDPTCTKCGGDGWHYINPCYKAETHLNIDYSKTRAVLSTVALDPNYAQPFGRWTVGDALMTVQGGLWVGYMDRFVGFEQIMAFAQLLKRGAADVVPVGWHTLPNTVRETALRYEPLEVNYVEDDDNIYLQSVDFDLVSVNGVQKVSWKTGRGPSVGTEYAIHYQCHPVWIVDDAVYAVQHSRGPKKGLSGPAVVQQLPTTFKVKLDFLPHER